MQETIAVDTATSFLDRPGQYSEDDSQVPVQRREVAVRTGRGGEIAIKHD